MFASSGFRSVRFPQPVGMHPWGVVFALLAVGLVLPAAQRFRPAVYVVAVGVWALFAAGFAYAFVANYSSAMASSPGIVALGLYVAHAHYLDATHRIRHGD